MTCDKSLVHFPNDNRHYQRFWAHLRLMCSYSASKKINNEMHSIFECVHHNYGNILHVLQLLLHRAHHRRWDKQRKRARKRDLCTNFIYIILKSSKLCMIFNLCHFLYHSLNKSHVPTISCSWNVLIIFFWHFLNGICH